MPGNKDKRIIQMQFENRQFEKNIAKSTKSVEELKQAMNFEEVSKGLKKFADGTKNLTIAGFEKMTDNIQKLTDKFTGLGTLSELVISQIRRGIENAAREISNFITSMSTDQVSAGMDKYNTLNKSVQTIKAATGETEDTVYKVLERLSNYTDQTSYNFADMAQNIGKFTSVGIDLESAEKQMEGIANWAARSGAGIQEASRAMYNLSQAMGVGKMTKIDWKSIENAGMATKEFKDQLIQAAAAMGTLKEKNGKFYTKKGNVEVNYKNVADTLAKGWATSQVLSATLEKYYYDDLYYENENQEAILKLSDTQKKEFDKMIASGKKLEASEWKALTDMGVISTDTRQKIVDLAVTYGKLTKKTDANGKVLYKTVNKTGKQIEFTIDDIEKSLGAGWFDKSLGDTVTSINTLAKDSYEAAQKCLTFTDVLGAWKDQVSSGWMKSFTIIFGELSEAMEFFSDVCNRVGEALDKIISFRNDILQGWKDAGGRQSLLDMIIGSYGDNTTSGAYGFLDMIEGVGKIIRKGLTDFFYLFMDPEDRLELKRDPNYIKTWLSGQLLRMTDGVKNFMKAIRDFLHEDITVNGKTTSRLEIIQNVVSGIAGAMKLGYDIITKALEFIGKIGTDLSPGFNELLGFFGDLGVSIFNTADEMGRENKIQKFFDGLREDVKPVTDSLNELMISLAELLRVIFGLDKEGATQTENIHAIGEAIRTVIQVISKVLGPFISFISKVIKALEVFFKNGVNAESLKQFGTDVGNAFGDMVKTFADSLPESMGFVKEWVDKLFGGGEEQVEKKSDSLFDKITGKKKEADKITKDAKKSASKGPGILGLMTGSNIAVWLGVASLASVVLLLRKARKVVGSVGDFIGGLGDSLKNGFKVKFQDESFATKFIKIAAAIALVAASIYVLGSMPLNALIQGGVAALVVCGIMFGMFKLLQKSAAKGSFKDQMAFAAQVAAFAFAMTALSVAIGILALALIPFTFMSWDQYAVAMAGLGGILLQMVAFMALLKVLKIGNIKLAGFAGFAIGIGLIVQGITPFANMSWDQYAKAMAGLGGVLLQLIAFMLITSYAPIGTGQLGGFIKFALSIAILVLAIKPFASMTWDQYAHAMAGLGGVLLQLIAFMFITSYAPIGTGQLGGFIKFALSLVILIQAIMPFKDMTWDQYAQVMAGLGGVLLQIIAFMWLFKQAGVSTKALNFDGIIKFVAAIWILIRAIMPFKDLTWEEYGKVMAGLGGVLLQIIAFMWLFKQAGVSTKALNFNGILIFVASIWLLIRAIMPFKDMTWDEYARVMAGLGGILLEIVAFMGLLKLVNFNKEDLGILGSFLTLAGGISALVNAILPFASMEWSEYAKTMAGLAGVLAIMLGFMALLKLVKPSIKNMLQMAIFAGIFAAVAGVFAVVLGLVADIDWKVITAFSAGLSVLIFAFAAAAALASVVGIKGFVILAAGLAILMGVIALLAPILIGSVMGAIRDASASLVLISDMISKFSDNMGGVSESGMDKAGSVFDKVIALVKKLTGMVFQTRNTSAFMYAMSSLTLAADEIIKFDNHISRVSDDGGASKLSGIVSGYKGILENELSGFEAYTDRASAFYDVMFKLGSAFDYFDSMTGDVASADDNQGLQLIKQLAACASDLDTIYKMDLDRFKNQLAELGGAMIVYAQGAKTVEGENITDDTDVSGAVTLLRKISESLTENGGFAIPENMPKEDQITKFGTQLAALAGALVAFEEAGSTLGEGKDKAIETLSFFRDLKEELALMPGFGSDIASAINSFKDDTGTFIKNDELTIFAEDIAQLGSAMAHFASSTQIVDEETHEVKPIDFSLATDALDAIAGLGEKLPSFGGLKELIVGRKESLGELATEINLLGDAISEFYTNTNTFDETNKTATPFDFGTNDTGVLGFLNSIADIQNELPTVKSFSLQSLFEDKKMSFGELGAQLILLGSGLHELSDAISGETEGKKNFDITAVQTATDALTKNIIPLMESLGTDLPKVGGLGRIIETAWNGREFNLTDLSTQLGSLGTGLGTLGTNLNTGAWSDNTGVKNAFDSMNSVFELIIKIQEFYVRMEEVQKTMPTWNAFSAFTGLSEFLTYLSDEDLIGQISGFMFSLDTAVTQWAKDTDDDLDKVLKRMESFKLFAEGLAALISTVDTERESSTSWSYIGNKLTAEIAKSITDGTASVVTAITDMVNAMYTAGNNVPEADWKLLGENIASGVELGVKTAGPERVTPAVKQMMTEAYEAGKRAIDSNSPSRLFMELGSFMGEGTAIGIGKSTGEVGEKASEMGEVALDSARDMIGLISRIMAEGTDVTPTIAPILDMTNIEAGMAQFRDSLNGYGINLDTSYSAGRAAHLGTSGYEDTQALKPDYSGIYNQMDKLGSTIREMGEEIKRLKLVLDTGVVAGGVADILDEEYGRRNFYASRE